MVSPIFSKQTFSYYYEKAAEWLMPVFTPAGFLNGKLDLRKAEAVADLISSDNEASHQIAMQQMRGGFSNSQTA
jgi:tRNA modification GTPase